MIYDLDMIYDYDLDMICDYDLDIFRFTNNQ